MNEKIYPTKTENPNIPKNAFLVFESVTVETIYITEDGRMERVRSGKGDFPIPASLSIVCRVTGDVEQIVQEKFNSWKRR
jgi:hypothetical protein